MNGIRQDGRDSYQGVDGSFHTDLLWGYPNFEVSSSNRLVRPALEFGVAHCCWTVVVYDSELVSLAAEVVAEVVLAVGYVVAVSVGVV